MKRTAALFFLLIFIKILVFAQEPPNKKPTDLLALANKIKDIKDKDSAAKYANGLIAKAQSEKNKIWEAQILLAQAYQAYSLGDIEEAKNFGQQSALLTNPTDSVTYVKANLMAAYMLNRQGKDAEALRIAFAVMRKAEKFKWKVLLVESKICIADIYRTVKELKKGLTYAQQAYNEAKVLNDTSIYIFSISTLSNLYSNSGLVTPQNLEKATKLYKIILSEPYVSTLSLFAKARHLSNLARLYEMQDKFQLAEDILLQSIAISKKEGYKNIEAHALNELMTVNIDRARYKQAIVFGQRAADLLANENDNNILQRNIYRNLSSAYVGVKNFEKALLYSEQSRIISDTLAAKDKMEIAERLDEEYKADKRIIEANANAKFMKQQRNFIILIALSTILVLVSIYRWYYLKRKKQSEDITEKHLQEQNIAALKTKFFNNISHELRTPLTLISGPAAQLYYDEKILSVAQRKSYTETIWLNSKKLLNLFNELLELGKLQSAISIVNKQPTAINDLIDLVYQRFSAAAQYKKIDFQLRSSIKANTVIEIDNEKLDKILSNLISNAIKFTPANGYIYFEANLDQGVLHLKVIDNGIGIPKDKLKLIFERYYQVEDDKSNAEGGTGIGLAIAKELVQLLGGNINVDSTPEKGTCFSLTIPAKVLLTIPAIPIKTIENNVEDHNVKDMVLVVEDQVEMASYIASILKPHYDLQFASNGIEALQYLNKSNLKPSLIISDMMMPEMDGLTLLKKLKQHEVFCSIPVVMLTAMADESSKYNALNIGVDDYITKPFHHTELLTRVVQLIDNLNERANFMAKEQIQPETENYQAKVAPADLVWLKELETLVKAHTGKKNLDVATISYEMKVSERQLFRNIKRITGLTPNKYIRIVRLQIARAAIDSGKYKTLSEIAYVAGFETPAYFSKLFKEHYGRDVNDLIH